MPSHGPKTTGELIIVHQESRESRTRARAHLAHNGIRKRIQKQRGQDHDSSAPPGSRAVAASPIPAPVALSGFSMVEYLISTNIFPDLNSTWGVNPAVCPGPANLSHTLSRASDVLECIFRANLAFHWLDLNLWTTPEKKRNMKVAALTYRGQALALAQKELLHRRIPSSTNRDTKRQPVHPANREICFGIVLRMLHLDYRFARCDVQAHFVACRQLLRDSSDSSLTEDQQSLEALASTIRNPHLHHLMITFECINRTPNSVIWDDADLGFLTRNLYQFVNRIQAGDVVSTENRTSDESTPTTLPRVSPSTILWRCLTKRPTSIPSNIYRDVCESSAQIAALLLICSVFLDYEDDSERTDTSIPYQCVEELENALFALGEENAVSSALNSAWLLAGGLGLPLTHRRARLWSVSGMLYALKRSSSLDLTVTTSGHVVNAQYVKQGISMKAVGYAILSTGSFPALAPRRVSRTASALVASGAIFTMVNPSLLPPELRKLSDDVYVYDPFLDSQGDSRSSTSDPTTVVLYTWADAHVRLVQKYFQGYRDLYPSTKIIIVMAKTMKTFFAGRETNQAVVRDMVVKELWPLSSCKPSTSSELPDGVKYRGTSQPRILMHAFSNSGAVNLEATALVWHSLQLSVGQSIGPLPIHGLILDSTPGGSSFSREFQRWTAGVALGFAFLPRLLAKLVAAIIVLLRFGLPGLFGKESLPVRGRRVTNSPDYIPTTSGRLYIYSDSDPLIGDKDVESHGHEAKAKGYQNIELEKFQGSGHVAHMRQDPKRYWAAIARFWDERCV